MSRPSSISTYSASPDDSDLPIDKSQRQELGRLAGEWLLEPRHVKPILAIYGFNSSRDVTRAWFPTICGHIEATGKEWANIRALMPLRRALLMHKTGLTSTQVEWWIEELAIVQQRDWAYRAFRDGELEPLVQHINEQVAQAEAELPDVKPPERRQKKG